MGRHKSDDTGYYAGPVLCECLSCEASKCYITVNTRTKTDIYCCKACGFKAIHSPASEDTPIVVTNCGEYSYRTIKTGDKLFI